MGDAAHPMYPRGSNGSAQALIDGRTLAELGKTQRCAAVTGKVRHQHALSLEAVTEDRVRLRGGAKHRPAEAAGYAMFPAVLAPGCDPIGG